MKKTVLLLGGLTRNESSYKRLISSSSTGVFVHVLAHKSLPVGNIAEVHKEIIRFIERTKVNKIYLAGHSLGGALAIEFAYHYPEYIEKLYLIDSEGVFVKATLWAQFLAMVDNQRTHTKKKIKENIRAVGRVILNPLLYLAAARYAYTADLKEEAKNITVPTMILWGDKDSITPVEQGEILQRLIPGSKLIILKAMDHDWLFHNPSGFWSNF